MDTVACEKCQCVKSLEEFAGIGGPYKNCALCRVVVKKTTRAVSRKDRLAEPVAEGNKRCTRCYAEKKLDCFKGYRGATKTCSDCRISIQSY